jgi:CcmD family protein
MNSIKYLYAAYIATWLIQGFYIVTLMRRYGALRQRMQDLSKARK